MCRSKKGMVTTDIDASILTDHMMLMAAELGLGSVWICYFKPDVLKQGRSSHGSCRYSVHGRKKYH